MSKRIQGEMGGLGHQRRVHSDRYEVNSTRLVGLHFAKLTNMR